MTITAPFIASEKMFYRPLPSHFTADSRSSPQIAALPQIFYGSGIAAAPEEICPTTRLPSLKGVLARPGNNATGAISNQPNTTTADFVLDLNLAMHFDHGADGLRVAPEPTLSTRHQCWKTVTRAAEGISTRCVYPWGAEGKPPH
jgi:hypothetical protein